MKRKVTMLLGVFVLCLSFVLFPTTVAQASSFAAGDYQVPFELKESGNNNTSIADGYFKKPAKLIVKNGKNYVQLTTTESDWVKSISGPHGAATVIRESGNERTVQLQVGDITKPVNLKMHIVVPKDIAGMEYDHHHSVRAVFNTKDIPAGTGGASEGSKQGASTTTSTDSIDNPKTGDKSKVGFYTILLILSIGGYAIYKKGLVES